MIELGDNINAFDFQKMTSLCFAAKRHSDIVNNLLGRKADLERFRGWEFDWANSPPCRRTSRFVRRYSCSDAVWGADPNTSSDHDLRSIHRVTKKGFNELASLPLKAKVTKANMHLQDS
jgi:hypothetical protein